MLRTMAMISRLDLSASTFRCLLYSSPQQGRSPGLGDHSEIALYCAQTSAKTQVQFLHRTHPRSRQEPAGGCEGCSTGFPSLLTPYRGSVMVIAGAAGSDRALTG